MRRRHMKRKCLPMAALCLLLAGCMPLSVDLQPSEQQYELNIPAPAGVEPATGDQISEWDYEATLYFPGARDQTLVAEHKTVAVRSGHALAQCLVEALLEGPSSADARAVAPAGTTLLSLRQSGNVAIVNLSVDARNLDGEQQLLWMRAAIAATLCHVDGIDYVDVLIAGRAASFTSIPAGACASTADTPATQWAQAVAEAELFAQSESENYAVERTAILYYPTRDGLYVAPAACALTFETDDYLSVVLDALSGAQPLDPALKAVLPESETPVITDARIVRLEDGRLAARLTFDSNLTAILEKNGVSAWQMYASITCTLTGFLPGLDGVQIYIGDGQLTRIDAPYGEMTFENGVMTRAQFETAVCQLRTIYMTATDGSLRAFSRPMAEGDSLSVRMLLSELFGSPKDWETGVSRVIPDGVTPNDLLGIRIEDGEAVLNFSASFYAGCQRLNEQQERNLVYALVDTLTNLPFVSSVRIQIEGEAADALVQSICLTTPLLRNPGLISLPDGAASAAEQ